MNYAQFEVLAQILLKIQIVSDMMLCCWANNPQHFKGSQHLQLQGRAVQEQQPFTKSMNYVGIVVSGSRYPVQRVVRQ